jgi:hypothetical protein
MIATAFSPLSFKVIELLLRAAPNRDNLASWIVFEQIGSHTQQRTKERWNPTHPFRTFPAHALSPAYS